MENMDKGLTVPKYWPKIPQIPQNLSVQIVCSSPKVWDFDEKRLQWASVVRVLKYGMYFIRQNVTSTLIFFHDSLNVCEF